MRTVIKSTESEQKSFKTEFVRFLCVPIPDKNNVTLEDCFNEYIKSDIISSWESPNKNKEDAIKETYIEEFPYYLIFQLKRFMFDGSSKKNDALVNVEEKWYSTIFSKNIYYELKGIVLQSGNLSGGHYVSYIKINNKWFCFNDGEVSKVKTKLIMKVVKKSYMLFYIRKNKKRESPSYYDSKRSLPNKKYKLIVKSLWKMF